MSASLVGSEMCIRDSLRPAIERLVQPCAFSARSNVCMSFGRMLERSTPCCLLYTSDAADDM
eukprot:2014764-Alexandrium_andersonii.AAC.1